MPSRDITRSTWMRKHPLSPIKGYTDLLIRQLKHAPYGHEPFHIWVNLMIFFSIIVMGRSLKRLGNGQLVRSFLNQQICQFHQEKNICLPAIWMSRPS
jgi:hypothetical protein